MGLLDLFRKKSSAPPKSVAPTPSDAHHFPHAGNVYQIDNCLFAVLSESQLSGKGTSAGRHFYVRELHSGELSLLSITYRTNTSPRTYNTRLCTHTARPNSVLTDSSWHFCYERKWENVEYHPLDYQRIICMHHGNQSYTDIVTGKEYYSTACQESRNIPKGTLVSAYLHDGVGYFGASLTVREKGMCQCVAYNGQLVLRCVDTKEIITPDKDTFVFGGAALKEGKLYSLVYADRLNQSINKHYPNYKIFPNALVVFAESMITLRGQYLYDDDGISYILNPDTFDMTFVPADCMPEGIREDDFVKIHCVAQYDFWTDDLPREYYEILPADEPSSAPAAPFSADDDCGEYDDPQVIYTLGEENTHRFKVNSSNQQRARSFSLFKGFTTFVDEGIQQGDRIYVDHHFDAEEDAHYSYVYRYRKSLLGKMNVIPGKEIAIYQGFSKYAQAFNFKLLSADKNEIKPVYLSSNPVIEGSLRIGECVKLENHWEGETLIVHIVEDRETTQEWHKRIGKC